MKYTKLNPPQKATNTVLLVVYILVHVGKFFFARD